LLVQDEDEDNEEAVFWHDRWYGGTQAKERWIELTSAAWLTFWVVWQYKHSDDMRR